MNFSFIHSHAVCDCHVHVCSALKPLEAQDSHSPHITEESTGINSTQYTYVHVKVVKIIVVPSVTASRI